MVGALAVHIEGCTAIGFTLGAVADQAAGKGPATKLLEVKPGTSITVWSRDGTQRSGQFMGIAGIQDSLLVIHAGQPTLTGARIRLVAHGSQIEVPADSVTRVSVPVRRGKVTGALVGLAADAAMVAVAAASVSSSGCD
jgi:hypothetical protein